MQKKSKIREEDFIDTKNFEAIVHNMAARFYIKGFERKCGSKEPHG